MKNFYKKCQILWKFPLWPHYLQWVYKKAIHDSSDLGILSLSKRKNPTILLCGVAGEITANEFITFVLKQNSVSKIIIIDIGKEQIESVRRLVKEKFSDANIIIRQADALNLEFINDKSIHWIDTDGFFSFFDKKQLVNLLKEWKRILHEDGFITFRELTSHGSISSFLNIIRNNLLKLYLRIESHMHTEIELKKDFQELRYKYSHGNSPIPLFDRFCLINI